ncbi:MAG: hypothetical protein NWS18_01355 [Schleiferiaceae bacterium]|nr:hypothetical protein [Schleiferiaceae bacterium]MDP4627107.1 hypothetical protein [Schleiferiaceae bacterium]MDP4727864.1 hypothetical protein [Schleiferiaceae bacterium]MDP4749291.1 hypothetical protein [Schleiferiaceae bacterium]MDP4858702.1 hypothetical protein [Schleiferiaceae bacterium]
MQDVLAFASLGWALYTLVRVLFAPSKASAGCDACETAPKTKHG